MKANRKFKEDENGFIMGIDYLIGAILVLVMSALAIAIVYPIISGVPIASIDTSLRTALGGGAAMTPAANSTNTLLTTTGTVMGLNPMMALVYIAAGIIIVLLSAFSGAGGRQTL